MSPDVTARRKRDEISQGHGPGTVLAKVIGNRIIHSAPTQQQHRSRKQLLDALRQLLRERGSLSRKIIDEAEGMPAVGTYQKRSGVLPAYELIGYATTSPRPI